MNAVHIHLLLNHLPVIGSLIGVALLVVALLRRDSGLAKVTLGLFVALAGIALVVFLTGEPAEELVEGLAGVSESILEAHEEAAVVATVAIGVLGVAALGLLVMFRQRRLPRWATLATLVAALLVAGVMGWTANLGGQIRHTEIRPSAAADAVAGGVEDGDHDSTSGPRR